MRKNEDKQHGNKTAMLGNDNAKKLRRKPRKKAFTILRSEEEKEILQKWAGSESVSKLMLAVCLYLAEHNISLNDIKQLKK